MADEKENINFYTSIFPSIAAGFIGNMVAIPFSVVFVEAATQSVKNKRALSMHEVSLFHQRMLKQIFTSPAWVYRGGIARTFQKVTTAVSGKLWSEKNKVPENYTSGEKFFYTVSSAGIGGFLVSPVSNFFKFYQNNKIKNVPYNETGRFLVSKAGAKKYILNTIPFSIGELLRCAAFIGISVFIREHLEINKKEKFSEKVGICFLASTCSSIVESFVGLVSESFNVVQSQIHGSLPQEDLRRKINLKYYTNFFKETNLHNPRILAPLYATLFVKNFMANSAFTCTDEATKQLTKKN